MSKGPAYFQRGVTRISKRTEAIRRNMDSIRRISEELVTEARKTGNPRVVGLMERIQEDHRKVIEAYVTTGAVVFAQGETDLLRALEDQGPVDWSKRV